MGALEFVNTFIKNYSCPFHLQKRACRRFFGPESVVSCEYDIYTMPVSGNLSSIASMVSLDADISRLNVSLCGLLASHTSRNCVGGILLFKLLVPFRYNCTGQSDLKS
jgi:hypothetical protein